MDSTTNTVLSAGIGTETVVILLAILVGVLVVIYLVLSVKLSRRDESRTSKGQDSNPKDQNE